MKIIGLTGGIGSGKSLVLDIIRSLSIPTYSADEAGRRLLNTDPKIIEGVTQLFGVEAYENGLANRPFIAQEVFQSKEKLEALNRIIHPVVIDDFQGWRKKKAEQGFRVCVRESAILFESNTYRDCDLIFCVTAEDDIRIARVMERDGVSKEKVLERMGNQLPQREVASRSNMVIDNSGRRAIIPQVLKALTQADQISSQ